MKLSRAELKELYSLPLDELKTLAKKQTLAVHGKSVIVRGLVEFSNQCACDCLYCGIRRSNTGVRRYRLEAQTILDIVKQAFDKGIRSFVLQSGERTGITDFVIGIARDFRILFGDEAALTVSCGIKTAQEYRELRQAGVDRYLLRFETCDETLHNQLRAPDTLRDRLKALENIRAAGLQLGSGFMTGLPGETPDKIVDNVLLCAGLGMDMGGIGPFIPHPATPLGNRAQVPIEASLRATALTRLALPRAHLSATTAAGSLDPRGREMTIECGANVLMPNITPVESKPDYSLYPGKICLDESGLECVGCLSARMLSVGRTLAFTRGDSLEEEIIA